MLATNKKIKMLGKREKYAGEEILDQLRTMVYGQQGWTARCVNYRMNQKL